jgi:hypothetical protein
MRSFCEGCGSFLADDWPFGGHGRSLSPAFVVGIPDGDAIPFFRLKPARGELSDSCLEAAFVCATRVIKGEFSFRCGELGLPGDPNRCGELSRWGDPNRWGEADC